MNTWKFENKFQFRTDLTNTSNGKNSDSLDEVLLDVDIGGFLSGYIFENVEDLKNNNFILKEIYGSGENMEQCYLKLFENWNSWD